jgi:hypothetical protein
MPELADEDHAPSPRSLTTLLATLLVLLLLPGFGAAGALVPLLSSLLLTVLLLAGVLSLTRHPALRGLCWALVLAAIGARWLSGTGWVPSLRNVSILLTLLSLLAISWVVILQVSQTGAVTAHHVRGAMALYLLIAAIFAYAYSLVALARPGAFQMPASWVADDTGRPESFFYFSVVTLTTLGYGDMTAVAPGARDLVMLEALLGQLYPAIIIARLVTLELSARQAAVGPRLP